MRIKNFNLLIVVQILVLSIVVSACSTSKKAALECPPISINKSNSLSSNHKKPKKNNLFANNRTKPVKHSNRVPKKTQSKDLEIVLNSDRSDKDTKSEIESIKYLNKTEFSKGLIASIDSKLIPSNVSIKVTPNETVDWGYQQVRCDTIVLKSGSTLVGKVEEIGQTEIKYRKCNNLSGPIISISKSDVSAILYSNGSHDIIATQNPVLPINNSSSPDNGGTKQTDGFAIGGFVSGLVGLFVFPLLFGAVAIVFGAISLSRIKKNPSKYKGKGLAIASIIIGIAGIVVAIIIAAAAA